MSQVLFRCSRLGELVTGSEGLTTIQKDKLATLRAKKESGKITDNQIIELGQLLEKEKTGVTIAKTTESFVRSVWLERAFGYKEEFSTEETLKGLLCEDDSLGLVQSVLGGEFRAKNQQSFANDFVCGTPDVILKKQDVIEDVKTSFNLRTFTESELIKNYWWQGQGYMWLTGKKHYRLIYCLVPTPENLLDNMKRPWYYKFGADDENRHYKAAIEQINHNNDLILQIPEKQRIRVFEFDYEEDKIELLKGKIEVCRAYYDTLKLTEYQKIIVSNAG